MIYILSISFQVAGALLLMTNVLSTRRDNVIRRFIGNSIIIRDNNTGKLEYDHNSLYNTFREAYLSRCAFVEIIIGYLIGIFSKNEGVSNKLLYAGAVILITILLIFLSKFIVSIIITRNKNVNRVITNEELNSLNLHPTIENLSMDDIDSIFHE